MSAKKAKGTKKVRFRWNVGWRINRIRAKTMK